MRNTSVGVVAALFIFLLSYQPAFASADEAKKVFDSLFAAKIKAVTTTGDRSDDIALGKEMLAIAKTSQGQPELLALICDQVHDLCIRHADGFATAVQAQQLLADTVETKRASAQEKLTTLLTRQMTIGKAGERETAGESLIALLVSMGDEKFERKQYAEAAGDYRRAVTVATQRKSASLEEAKAKLEFAASRDRAMKNLARLQEKILEDATDSGSAEELVRLYILDLNDAAAAKPYLDRVKDEKLRALANLSAKPATDLSEAECLDLGEWFVAQSEKMPALTRHGVLRRAEVLLERFLRLHTASDATKIKAQVRLKEVQKAMADASVSSFASREPRSKMEPGDELTGRWTRNSGEWTANVMIARRGTKWQIDAQVEGPPGEGVWRCVDAQYKDGSLRGTQEWLKKPVEAYQNAQIHLRPDGDRLIMRWSVGDQNGSDTLTRVGTSGGK